MPYNFDHVPDRKGTDSLKWQRYGEALPLWVADMDFPAPEPVLSALQARIAHGVLGYATPPAGLGETICERLANLYGWHLTPEAIVYLPGLVSGLNVACRAIGQPGDAVLTQTPVYPPFLSAPLYQHRALITAPLRVENTGQQAYYTPDVAALSCALTDKVQLFLLCNPHNPVGRAFQREELHAIAALCEQHDLVICSDEIHCDLLLNGYVHMPIATLGPDIAQRCITLMAPSKTFNIPGLGASFAIIENAALRRTFKQAMRGIVPEVNVLGLHAMWAAYAHGAPWLQALLDYLTANRNALTAALSQIPNLISTVPEATYLTWIDCTRVALPDYPQRFFLQKAGVALSDGRAFGPGGEGHVRLNFGCTRGLLTEAIVRMLQYSGISPVVSLE